MQTTQSILIRPALLLAVAVVIALSGCHLSLDQWPPGNIGTQRARATVHDPYPSNDLGPPIMGGRPLGFDLPASEAESLQDPIANPYRRRGGRANMPTGF